MEFQILKNPMSMLEVHLGKGETIAAEAVALVFMKVDIEVSTNICSGFFNSADRSLPCFRL
ncbi:MAG TPA: AIM24 family protein [Candidatus Nitrosotenuis sp.]|nr:AIM24 family protein [Candidatus Nitrosotenuis sp.]